jgi:putative ABC transport system permease protein
MDSLLWDLRYALRGLRRAPTFTAVAVLTLGLGLGATTAIFTVVDTVLLEPLPFPHPESLYMAGALFTSRAEYVRLRERTRAFVALSVYTPHTELAVSGDGEPVRVTASSVSADLFTTLGIGAQLGRTFLPDDNNPGHDRIMIVSHDFWLERFGGDPQVLGRTLRVDGMQRTVVGVMPASFHFPNARVKFWFPFELNATDIGQYWGEGVYQYVGRLKPDVTIAQATSDTRSVAHGMLKEFPWRMPDAWGDSAFVEPLRQDMAGPARPMLLLLLGGVSLVLLVACVNVANLVLARATAREREMAIRTAVGGTRWRLARQLLTESLTLATLGGLTGVVLALAGLRLFISMLPADTPRLAEVHLDARVLLVAALLVTATGLAFGLAPVLRLARRAGAGRRAALGDWLVTAQIAIAVVLVIGAGLLGKSLVALQSVDPGYKAERLVTATLAMPSTVRDSSVHTSALVTNVLERVRQIPGVQSAAVATTLPLTGQPSGTVIGIEAHPLPEGAPPPSVGWDFITPDYFRTLGVSLREGRLFTDADRTGALPVVIIDAVAARTFWPGQDPIGQRVRHSWMQDWMTVVGVVGSVRHDSLNAEPRPAFYRPFLQQATWELWPQLSLAVRSTRDPGLLVPALRAAVASADPNVPLSDIAAASDMISRTAARPRTTTALLGAFALAALLLGAIGIYGVMSHAVARRTRDTGIRMALGARAENVLAATVRQGLMLVLAGVALGLVGAVAATRVLRAMLFGVSPVDPVLYASVPCLFAIVAIAATWGPARRAARIDPVIAIRSD